MQHEVNDLAIVTGASSGIGRAVALSLAARGFAVLLVARRGDELTLLTEEIAAAGGQAFACPVDLLDHDAGRMIAARVAHLELRVKLLVHSAAAFSRMPFTEISQNEFERLFQLNVHAPLHLTQCLLPYLIEAKGHVVFINSSAALRASRNLALYSATKHALKAMADALRIEVNEHGVRVLSIYCGRVATAMQERNHEIEGRPYRPELLTQPQDVAEAIMHALQMPVTTEVTDLHMRPAQASY